MPRRLPLLACAALLLTVAALLRFGAATDSVVIEPLRGDAREYFLYAYNWRLHGVYSRSDASLSGGVPGPDAYRRPGYPLFLAAFVDGPPDAAMLRAVALAQAALGVLAVLFTLVAALRWMPPAAALAAALLTALSPHLVNAGAYLLTETLFTTLLAALLWALGAFDARPGGWRAVAAGLLLGAACHVRPSALLLVPALLWLLWRAHGRGGARVAALLLAGFLVCELPWQLRNALVDAPSDRSVLLATAVAGLYPDFMHENDPRTYGYAYRFDPRAEAMIRDPAVFAAETARRFVEAPAEQLRWFLLGKPLALWSWDIVQGQGDAFVYEMARSPYYQPGAFQASHFAMRWLHWPLVALGLAGALLAWTPGTRARLAPGPLLGLRAASLMVLGFTALHVALAPYPRYSVPLRPALYALAAFAVFCAVAAGARLTRR